MRILGYLDFYNKTNAHHRLPMYIISLWNTAIIVIQGIMDQFYPDNFSEKCVNSGAMSPLSFLCALITLEFCLIAGINITYIGKWFLQYYPSLYSTHSLNVWWRHQAFSFVVHNTF